MNKKKERSSTYTNSYVYKESRMYKKSQITIYIILGLVVLLLFGFIIFIHSHIISAPVATNLDSVSVVRYIDQCMQTKVESTIDLLFKQGGWLYVEDGGYIRDSSNLVSRLSLSNVPLPSSMPSTSSGTTQVHIAYAILDITPPQYTVPTNYKRPLNTKNSFGQPIGVFNTDTSTPYFGTNVLPKLCNRDGPNGVHAESAFSCIPQLYNSGLADRNYTIQSQLNRALDGAIFSCIQDAQTQFSFDHEGDGSVDIIFGDTSVEVPVNITISSKSFRIPLSFNYDIRLKRLYSFSYLFVDRDTKDINFDKRYNASLIKSCSFDGSQCYDAYMNITIFQDYVLKNPAIISAPRKELDDIIIISDRQSPILYASNKNTFVDTNFLTFQFAVENRRPYLEVIPNLPNDARIIGDDFSTTAKDLAQRTMTFYVYVYDPDEDSNTIYLSASSATPALYSMNRLRIPEYFSPAAGTRIPYNTPYFSSIALIPRTDGVPGLQGTLTFACSTQCRHIGHDRTQASQYFTTYYPMKMQVSDGDYGLGKEDFQTFDIIVSPR